VLGYQWALAPEESDLREQNLNWRRRIFPQNPRQALSKKSRVRIRKNQRRPKFDDVVMRPIGPSQDPEIAQPIYDIRRLLSSRRPRLTIIDEINPQKKA
jgi:hypothetical protein